jgi:hypothetical protein
MSVVHVTRRPNPCISCHETNTSEMGYKRTCDANDEEGNLVQMWDVGRA